MSFGDDVLSAWCEKHLGSGVDDVIVRAGYFSDVVGVVLFSGLRAVIKIRPEAPRLAACARVQAAMRAAGFPATELLVAPAAYGSGRVASAEALVDQPGGRGTAGAYARLLADQVRLASQVTPGALDPAPAWVRWQHDEPGLWPTPDDHEVDLNSRPIDWIDSAATVVRGALATTAGELAVGHVDWLPQNVWWDHAGSPVAVHDWDSLAALPEPAIAGVAAAIFTENATVDQSADFLDAYQARSRTAWTGEQTRTAWAAGLWVRLFDAKKDTLMGRDNALGEEQARERLALATETSGGPRP